MRGAVTKHLILDLQAVANAEDCVDCTRKHTNRLHIPGRARVRVCQQRATWYLIIISYHVRVEKRPLYLVGSPVNHSGESFGIAAPETSHR